VPEKGAPKQIPAIPPSPGGRFGGRDGGGSPIASARSAFHVSRDPPASPGADNTIGNSSG
jgi:hypothetical protein